jgi:hypothetical protein
VKRKIPFWLHRVLSLLRQVMRNLIVPETIWLYEKTKSTERLIEITIKLDKRLAERMDEDVNRMKYLGWSDKNIRRHIQKEMDIRPDHFDFVGHIFPRVPLGIRPHCRPKRTRRFFEAGF